MLDESKENSEAEPKKETKPKSEVKKTVKKEAKKVSVKETEAKEEVPQKKEKAVEVDTAKREESEKSDTSDLKETESKDDTSTNKSTPEQKIEEVISKEEVPQKEEKSVEVDTAKREESEKSDTSDLKETESKDDTSTNKSTPEQKTEEVVSEEKKSAAAEKKPVAKSVEFPLKDYKNLDLDTLVDELEHLVTNATVNKIKDNVEGIKSAFNAKFSAALASEKEAFIKGGGNSIDFHYSSPQKSKFNTLLSQYKRKRNQYYTQLENELQDNLKIKLDIIESLKELIDNAEVRTMYSSFKSLQERWRTVGLIPRNKYNDTWQTYHHHVERFYDLLHLNKDLRDLDFRHNLEEKEKLIKRAEALNDEENVDVAFKELQQLHKLWKEEVGPVQKELREEVWQRFSKATKVIHDKRHESFKELKTTFDENTAKKELIIEQITSVNTDELKSHSDWQNAIKKVEKLRDDFFKVGRVSRKQNEALWRKFKEATRNFNSQKNNFYKQIKSEQLNNLTKKRALLSQAQELKDSEDLEGTVALVKKIQADWKNIGHVPRKYSDKIWKEFKDACNHFFDRYHASKDEDDKESIEAFNAKKTYLESLKANAEEKDFEPSLELVKTYIKKWKTLGYVPSSMRHIEVKFNKFLEKLLGGLKLDKNELAMIKFKIMIDGYKAENNDRKIDSEQIFLRKKIDEITKEMQQLDNNMNFFANTSDDNPLLKKVKNDISKYQADLVLLKEKLNYIRKG
jgi:Domain of Unknown Function (DUF349)